MNIRVQELVKNIQSQKTKFTENKIYETSGLHHNNRWVFFYLDQ